MFRKAVGAGKDLVKEWDGRLDAYEAAHPRLAATFRRRLAGELADGWDADLKTYETGTEVATRNASQDAIQALAGPVPELFGGAADLSESNLTDVKGEPNFSADEPGRNLRFGVREHGMGGIANGIAYHGGFIPYDATFLTFSDYMRGAVRLGALAGLHVIHVWTHDSVGLGEDGPTHQPVEHYAALRAIPNLWFVRPGDANETAAAWALAVERRDGPVALALTRQKLPVLAGTAEKAREGLRRGAYVLRDAAGDGDPELIFIATGSELQLAFAAAERARGGRHPRPRRVDCPAGRRSTSRTRRIATRSCRRPSASASASRSACRSAGSAGSATRARSSASTISAPRRRPARSSRSSGSPRTASPTSAGASCARACAAASRPSTAATSGTWAATRRWTRVRPASAGPRARIPATADRQLRSRSPRGS